MKWIVALWASPLALFWGWYFLSLNDVNFGYIMLSRQVHDLIFQLYGEMLGIDPKTIPALIAEACLLDSVVLGAIYAFRRRMAIRVALQQTAFAERLRTFKARYLSEGAAPNT